MLGLGIDTGGTYTDAVLFDLSRREPVAWAKSLTTREDLSLGIRGALSALPTERLGQVELVSLSTTLATNACVENQGGRAGLILIGYNPALVAQLASGYGLDLVGRVCHVPGSHTQRGELAQPLDEGALRAAFERLGGQVDAIGVCEYWGVRNPAIEQRAMALMSQWSDLPLVAAHELTGEINSIKRAVTCALNARLIPLLRRLLDSVAASLAELGVDAPLMVVRGDGTLMSQDFARMHPVETLLSGPAASAAGGRLLARAADALVIDMGGTTTDLAMMTGGRVRMAEDGVRIGPWRTGTRAADVDTCGLGGDSHITFDAHERLTIGPGRALPLCQLAARHPQVLPVLEGIRERRRYHSLSLGEFFLLVRRPDPSWGAGDEERALLDALADGPLDVITLAERAGQRPFFLKLERLLGEGYVLRSALTLTDLWHVTGQFIAFDRRAARLGLDILADRLEVPAEALMAAIADGALRRLYDQVTDHLLRRALPQKALPLLEQPGFARLMDLAYTGRNGPITLHAVTPLTLVGIGAPAAQLVPQAAERLGAACVVPPAHEVAGAVGAITGGVVGTACVVIRPVYTAQGVEGYTCHSGQDQRAFEDYPAALAWAEQAARTEAEAAAKAMGAREVTSQITVSDHAAPVAGSAPLLLDSRVAARAVGRDESLGEAAR
ncbi:MAG: hydantoinase/oxoprolinase N-terminal domain-containing protein [Christensenellales bacterium]